MASARYRLTVETPPFRELTDALAVGLTEHARPYVDGPGFQPVAVALRDETGALVGGATGQVNWNWLHISLVWVAAELRGDAYGRRVMEAIEQIGRDRGCRWAHLDTFSYQARPFYERLGYELFATLDDYPPGHRRFFLKKAL